jgi:hypothetical protein
MRHGGSFPVVDNLRRFLFGLFDFNEAASFVTDE